MNLMDEIKMFPETQASSWRGWRSVMARIEGLEPEDPAFIERVTSRPDRTPTRELFAALGRSAGKTRFASVVAAAFAMRHFEHAIGEQIYLALFAPTVAQARIAHGYIAGLLQSNPTTATLISGEITQTTIPLGDLVVECLASNYKTLRSRSYGLVIVDEACFLPHEDSAIPDTELLRAVRPGLARVKGSRLLVISSPYARRGEMYKAYERHFGQTGHDTLFLKGTTLDFNPTFDGREITRAMEEDPDAARAEYLGEFRSDLEALFSIERIAAVTPTGVVERSSSGLQHLRAFVDPSGGSSDSFTLGIAGTCGETETLCCVREWKPPFSPAAVVDEIVQVLRSYGLRQVTGDAYSGAFVRELFRRAGVTYEPSPLNRSGIYLDALALINSRRCSLIDVPKLRAQLVALERRTGRTTDVIDHPRGQHDDLANAALGALVVGQLMRPLSLHERLVRDYPREERSAGQQHGWETHMVNALKRIPRSGQRPRNGRST